MIVIQRRLFEKGKPTEEIGLYNKEDRLVGILRDGHPKVQFIRGMDVNYWGQVLRRLGMTTETIREREKEGQAVYAWGWPGTTGEDGDEDDER